MSLFDLVAPHLSANKILCVFHGYDEQDYLAFATAHDVQDTWGRVAGVPLETAPSAWPTTDSKYDEILLPLPKGRPALALCLTALAPRLASNGRLLLLGSNDNGIKSAAKRLEDYFDDVQTLDIGNHGRLLQARLPKMAQSSLEDLKLVKNELISYPGLFANGELDEATKLLLQALPEITADASVLDYACGTGIIARELQQRAPSIKATLVDYDALAIHAARQNVAGGTYICAANPSDVTAYIAACENAASAGFDIIVSNPPIHEAEALSYRLVGALVAELPKLLNKKGAAYFVTQVTVPVARIANEVAKTKLAATEVAASRSFRVIKLSLN